MSERNTNSITEGVIWRQLLSFFFPIVLGTFFQQLYNTADSIIVGRFIGKEALGCVGGSSAQIVMLLVGFFVGLSSGATVIVAQHYGAGDRINVEKAMHTSAAFSILGSLVVMGIALPLSPKFLALMKTPSSMMAGSIIYLKIYFSGVFFTFVYNIGAAILRAVGDSKRPLYYLIAGCIVNIVLDLIFIVYGHMGIKGAALGTVLSQAVSAFLTLRALLKTDDMYKLTPRKIRFHGDTLKRILQIGIPAGVQGITYTISNITIQTAFNTFGTDTVAAWSAFGKIDAIFWMISGAYGISITTFVGQNYGAGKYDRAEKSVKTCLKMAIITFVGFTFLFFFCGRFFFSWFTTDKSVIDIGFYMMRLMAPGYFLFAFIEVLSGALRGVGDVLIPMILSCSGICVFRILWIIILLPKNPTVFTITISYPISWGITAILFILYYKRQKPKLLGSL